MKTAVLFALAALLLAHSDGYARPVRDWTYDDLLKESELVVIARAVRTRDVANTDDPPSCGTITPEHVRVLQKVLGRAVDPEALVVQQVETTFQIRAVIKGAFDKKVLSLVHFRWKSADHETRALAAIDGPLPLVSFPSANPLLGKNTKQPREPLPDCLLFLKLRKDGKYEPVSGQYQPADSVRWLHLSPPARPR